MATDTAPYPPLGSLDEVLAPILGGPERSLDALLEAVRDFAEQFPPHEGTFHRPLPGLRSNPVQQGNPPLHEEEEGRWFHMLLYNAGNTCYRAGEHHLALELYKQALLGFDHPAVYNNISAILCVLDRPQEALHWLERGAALDPDYPQTWLNLASLTLLKGLPGQPAAEYIARFRLAGGSNEFLAIFLECLEGDDRTRFAALLEEQ